MLKKASYPRKTMSRTQKVALATSFVRLATALEKNAAPQTEDIVEHALYRLTRDRAFLSGLADVIEKAMDQSVMPAVKNHLGSGLVTLIKKLEYQKYTDPKILKEYINEAADNIVGTLMQSGMGNQFQELDEALSKSLGSGKNVKTAPSGRNLADELEEGDLTQHKAPSGVRSKIIPNRDEEKTRETKPVGGRDEQATRDVKRVDQDRTRVVKSRLNEESPSEPDGSLGLFCF